MYYHSSSSEQIAQLLSDLREKNASLIKTTISNLNKKYFAYVVEVKILKFWSNQTNNAPERLLKIVH